MQHDPWFDVYCLLSSLFPCRNLVIILSGLSCFPLWLLCNDLSLPAKTDSHCPFNIIGLKTHLIKRHVMSPTQLPFCLSSSAICTYLGKENLSWAFNFLTWHVYLRPITITESYAVAWAARHWCLLSSLCLTPLFCLFCNIGHLRIEGIFF